MELRGRRWLSRGQSEEPGNLLPLLDRKLGDLPRSVKLKAERQAIELFQSTARFFSHAGEAGALADDFVALMVLRHYGAPTRLLDWSGSPQVAAFFAVCGRDDRDGEIWSFDYARYVKQGEAQWRKWPETTHDGSGDPEKFEAGLTAFSVDEPRDWFICAFYPEGFPRQHAQDSLYTVAARFGRDHADAIERLLADGSSHRRYVVRAALKQELRVMLREEFGIWRGSLFPDAEGAATTVKRLVFREECA